MKKGRQIDQVALGTVVLQRFLAGDLHNLFAHIIDGVSSYYI